jgi:hypothetical protein
LSYRRLSRGTRRAHQLDTIFPKRDGTFREFHFLAFAVLPAMRHKFCTFAEEKADRVAHHILHPGTEELRILYALTIVLGVSTPTLTSTTANTLTHINTPAFDLPAAESKVPPPLRLSLHDIEGFAGKLPDAAARVAKFDVPQIAKIDELSAFDQDDDDLAVTVPIERVCEALADAASVHGLPIGFFARLIWQESRFDQWARSAAGALGVAQFMPPTANEFGLRDPFDPLASINASARFLRQLRDQFGNLGLAAAAYNAGGGKIRKWLNGQTSLPEETQNYVRIITGQPAKRWTVAQPLAVSVALPQKAPCDGVEGLSRTAATALHEVKLTGLAMELLEQAAAAQRARIAAARAARHKRHGVTRVAKGSRNVVVAKAATGRQKARVRLAAASAR